MLPGRNGYRVCADLRRAGNSTPILMLTAKDGELDEAEALDTGADDYLRSRSPSSCSSPASTPCCDGPPWAEPPPVAWATSARSGARAGTLDGSEVPLTAREFDCSTYLVRRAGQW